MNVGREELEALLKLVDITRPEEIDCGEFLARVSGYLEGLEANDWSPIPGHADLVHHLKACPECLEEFEALYAALRGEAS